MNGIIHAHSRYSYDGSLTLSELRELFRVQNFRFACMTEHTDGLSTANAERFIQECRAVSDASFVFVPGFEVPYLDNHILVIGASRYHEGDAQQILSQWAADGALLVLAHPQRNGYRTDTFLREHLHGVEIWNSQYDGIHAPRRRSRALLRTLNDIRSLAAYGGLDLHRASHINGPHIELDTNPAEVDIVAILRTRNFRIRRSGVALDASGGVVAGSPVLLTIAGTLLPAIISALRAGSSLLHRIGIRTFPFKRWLRTRV